MNNKAPEISIIIVSYNVIHFLELCLSSVMAAIQAIDAEVIVIDNVSADGSGEMVALKFSKVKLNCNSVNVGFAKANNQGLELAQGKYIHFLNPDTIVPEDFYIKSLQFMEARPDAGCLGPRLIDGKGQYAPDSKKAFPDFWTSVYKVMGLARLFPKSTKFNRYYAAHIGEWETAPTDILSGCCLLVRAAALKQVGGGFDTSYFMYCEDVDLCHRIGQAGYKNMYVPETTVLHYKGESTRKLSYKYMKVFYKAHALFVKKYYPKNLGTIYITALRIVLAARNFFNWGRHLFSLLKLFFLDTLLLSLVTVCVIYLWFRFVADLPVQDSITIAKTVPAFVIIWILSLFLNGAYDKPFSVIKAARGMFWGSIIVLAGYGLLPFELRYSRGAVLLSAILGTAAILLARWLLSLFGLIKLIPRGKIDYKAVIVADRSGFLATKTKLKSEQYNLDIIGRVNNEAHHTDDSLCALTSLPAVQKVYEINEIIYNAATLPYQAILQSMQECAPLPYYKIHIGSAIVGSNLLRHPAEEFRLNNNYLIDTKFSRRNKRILDIAVSLFLFILYPLLRKYNDNQLLKNISAVFKGRKTWVGYPETYCKSRQLPKLKPAVLWPFRMPQQGEVREVHRLQIAEIYATNYSILDDLRFIWINFKFLGEKV